MLALLLSLIMGFFVPDEKPTPLDKFHAEIDLRYSVGLDEQECGATFHDSATRHGMMGFTFRLAALYDFTPAITAGKFCFPRHHPLPSHCHAPQLFSVWRCRLCPIVRVGKHPARLGIQYRRGLPSNASPTLRIEPATRLRSEPIRLP